jgi:hypothetical protein
MEEVNKYLNGKIYKLVNSNSDKIYIGSTYKTLNERLSAHKSPSNKATSRKIFEIEGDVTIELIENYPCNCKKDLWKREKELIELNINICINKCIPTRTKKDSDRAYYLNHKEERAIYRKKYYNEHKEEMINQHKEYIEANKEKMKEYFKDRYQKNKEQRKIYDKKRRETPEYKEKMKEYLKQYNRKKTSI